MLVPLADAIDPRRFGGKAASLARATRAGLPVPEGFALDVDATARLARDLALAARELERYPELAGGDAWAVRSSALDEDSARASFAGQHLTRLGARRIPALIEAIREVHASASAPGALAYRARQGIAGPPAIAIVVQRLIAADVAGVLFTRNPLTGADELFIEASWGLGEAVVASLVTPDRIRLARSGEVLERTLGAKEVQVVLRGDVVEEAETTSDERARPCLTDAHLGALRGLASAIDAAWAGPHDVEFGFVGGALFLLQRRPLTC